MITAGQLDRLPAREVATVARILSNGWRLMWCDRCEGNLEDAAECYQVAIGGTVWMYCPRCHRRNQREQAYEPRAIYAATETTETHGGDRASRTNAACSPVSATDAARTADVSTRYVDKAKKILREGTPEIIADVTNGSGNPSCARWCLPGQTLFGQLRRTTESPCCGHH